ncbi:MAG: porphobilinogen synthase [Chlamydiae bacterium CG10_big_fil_rev_8_21_14_0_10_35_9]|nr:MAG: porphobilinogen synthase [Chlamydiae bacterium CG10_big_fil_rev_8_21_14_0_10_35_9]
MNFLEKNTLQIPIRLRRNRRLPSIRNLIKETHLTPQDLILPFFVIEGEKTSQAVKNFPGIYRLSKDLLLKKAEEIHSQGVQAIALFPVIEPSLKTESAHEALNPKGIIPETVRYLKKHLPSVCIITDIALDPFTSHGHDGIVKEEEVLNDETIKILAKMSLVHAEAGADFIAPSDMMDGRIGYIRKALDISGFTNTGILSYSAKYASSLYNPFRFALNSNLQFGNKKTYQMDPANQKEALLEAELDEKEGADILMVKPASLYLDVISKLREKTNKPIAAYHVSGEYAMVEAAHQLGYLDKTKVFYETLLSIKRAGADMIFSYATETVLQALKSSH